VTLDGTQPWFAPLRALLGALPPGMPAAEALNRLPGSGPRFVAADALPDGEAYEAFIRRTAQVPTRDNLHDLLNGLIWRHHPALKSRLNALQAADIEAHGIGPVRGALRDALTLFDENGAIWLDPPPALAGALRARDWHTLFVQHRAWWPQQRFEVFGHALLEQLSSAPRKGLTAHVVIGDPLLFSAEQWAPNNGAQKPFLPLPVLGIPGWWPANHDPAFYDDSKVFRRPVS
jgi:Protein of unknown function (DUF3025)